MADDVYVHVDSEKLEKAMRKYPRRLYERLRARLGGKRGYLHKWVRHEIAGKKLDGSPLHSRTGTLRRSFDTVQRGSSLDSWGVVTGSVHNSPPYAMTHETGETIRPKNGQFLTIPLPAAKTGAGVARFSAREAMEQPDVTIIKTSRGSLMIVRKRKTRWEPLFLLVKSVTIPARLGFYDAWKKQLPALEKQFDLAIDEALSDEPKTVSR